MKISVIIPTLEKNKDYLKLCVESLRAMVDWDIIVVSNGSKTTYDLDDVFGISKRYHTSQQGQCHATNIGVKQAEPDSDYIMVSNDDMYYAPGWNKNLSFTHPVFSPNLVEPTDNRGSALPFLKVDGGYTLDKFDQKAVDKFIKFTVNREAKKSEVGFNLPFFIKKDLWDTIEGYDENYDPWGSNSDTDLQMKIELAGVTPRRVRDVLVYHFSNKSGTFEPENQGFWQNNWDYLTEKWGFNRDQLGSDPWYCKNMLPEDKKQIKFEPTWAGSYGKQ